MVNIATKFIKVSIGEWGRLTSLLGMRFEASPEDVVRAVARLCARERDLKIEVENGSESRKGRKIG